MTQTMNLYQISVRIKKRLLNNQSKMKQHLFIEIETHAINKINIIFENKKLNY